MCGVLLPFSYFYFAHMQMLSKLDLLDKPSKKKCTDQAWQFERYILLSDVHRRRIEIKLNPITLVIFFFNIQKQTHKFIDSFVVRLSGNKIKCQRSIVSVRRRILIIFLHSFIKCIQKKQQNICRQQLRSTHCL